LHSFIINLLPVSFKIFLIENGKTYSVDFKAADMNKGTCLAKKNISSYCYSQVAVPAQVAYQKLNLAIFLNGLSSFLDTTILWTR
jgi:hypothetical protein